MAGANIAYHESTLKPLIVSETDGTSGSTGVRSLVDTASAFKRPLLMCCVTEGSETQQLKKSAEQGEVPVVDFTETIQDDSSYLEWMESNISDLDSAING